MHRSRLLKTSAQRGNAVLSAILFVWAVLGIGWMLYGDQISAHSRLEREMNDGHVATAAEVARSEELAKQPTAKIAAGLWKLEAEGKAGHLDEGLLLRDDGSFTASLVLTHKDDTQRWSAAGTYGVQGQTLALHVNDGAKGFDRVFDITSADASTLTFVGVVDDQPLVFGKEMAPSVRARYAFEKQRAADGARQSREHPTLTALAGPESPLRILIPLLGFGVMFAAGGLLLFRVINPR